MPFGMEKLEWLDYPTVKKIWRHVYSFWQNSRTWTDTQTPHDDIDLTCIASRSKKWKFAGISLRRHNNSECTISTVSTVPCRMLKFVHRDSYQSVQTILEDKGKNGPKLELFRDVWCSTETLKHFSNVHLKSRCSTLPFIIIIIKQENNEWRIVKD